ncbi:MAG: MmgE/PrpD family protein [Chloroflexi bacterium]|nr:MmgE/PrpD family protein [Chloroflexota bacterium]
MGRTERLARFVVETGFGDFPRKVIDIAKEHNLDCLGVALAGSTHPVGKIVTRLSKEMGGAPEASILCGGLRTSAANAAFANGAMAHVHDFDDTWLLPVGHPTCAIFPVVFALGEKLKLSGRAVLEGYVMGTEVHGKIGGLDYHKKEIGFHHTGIYGAVGAAAAAAKMLKLDVTQTRRAFGIACSAASAARRNVGTMTKCFHAGNAARGGMTAALLAREGWTADENLLDEGYRGFTHTFIREESIPAPDPGKPYHIISPGIAIKKYPCCYGTHRALDATLQLVKEHDISYQDVVSVEVGIANPAFVNDPDPQTSLRAKFSLQYCLGAAILKRKVDRETFDEEEVHSPRMREALQKVRTIVQPELPANYGDAYNPVTIKLSDGAVYTRQLTSTQVAGSAEMRLSLDELLAKYRYNAQVGLGPEEVERSIELMLGLENVKDVSEIMEITRGAGATG